MERVPSEAELDSALEALRIMGNRARERHTCDTCVAMSHAAEQVDGGVRVLQDQLGRVRELHHGCELARCIWCHSCDEELPCTTLRALDAESVTE